MYNYLATIPFCCNFLQLLKNYLSFSVYCSINIFPFLILASLRNNVTQIEPIRKSDYMAQSHWTNSTPAKLFIFFFFYTIFIWNQQDGITQWKEVQEYLFDDTIAELSSGQFVSNKNTWFSWLTSFIIFVSILKFL